jgi:hypothetical protein
MQSATVAAVPSAGSILTLVLHEPVTWTLAPKDCKLLTSTLTASGQRRETINVYQNPDGTYLWDDVNEVAGTATDSSGRAYLFIYRANPTVVTTSLPTQPPQTSSASGPDIFQLIPADGGDGGYTTNIFFRAQFNPDGSFIDKGTVFSSNASCDPI